MLRQFYMNGQKWKVRFTHPENPVLVDRTGTMTCAVTDGNTRIIWISDAISGEFLTRVVLHELSHEEYYPALQKAFFTKIEPPTIIPKPARDQNGLLTVDMSLTINEYVGPDTAIKPTEGE